MKIDTEKLIQKKYYELTDTERTIVENDMLVHSDNIEDIINNSLISKILENESIDSIENILSENSITDKEKEWAIQVSFWQNCISVFKTSL